MVKNREMVHVGNGSNSKNSSTAEVQRQGCNKIAMKCNSDPTWCYKIITKNQCNTADEMVAK